MVRRLFPVLLMVFLLTAVLGCKRAPDYPRVSLQPSPGDRTTAAENEPTVPTIKIAIAGVVSAKQTFITYESLVKYIGERLGRPALMIQRPTYAEINELVHRGEVDLALVCTLAYVYGHQQFGMQPLVAPQVDGKAEYYSYIIVLKESPAREFSDLRGKVFAFSDPLSFSGYLAPVYLLGQAGFDADSFFKKYIYTYSHDNSIRAVAQGLVDAAAVDSLVYDSFVQEDPALGKRLRVIDHVGPVGSPPFVVGPMIDAELKSRLKDILLTMHEDEEGARVLKHLMIDRFVPVDDTYYTPIKDILNLVESAKNIRNNN